MLKTSLKESTLKTIQIAIEQSKELWDMTSDPKWEIEMENKMLELALTKELPDDDDFVEARFNLLSKHGLFADEV